MRRGKWSLVEVQTRANLYTNRGDFLKNDFNAYSAASRNGWLEKVCAHMPPSKKKRLTIEEVRERASKFDCVKTFRKTDQSAYNIARKLGIIEEIKASMTTRTHHHNRKHTLESVTKSAKSFTTRTEFAVGDRGAYNAAIRYGWLDEATAHMKGRKHKRHTRASIAADAKQCVRRTEFRMKFQSSYNAAKRMGIFNEVCAHMRQRKGKSPQELYTKSELQKIASQFTTTAAFKKYENEAYSYALRTSILKEISVGTQPSKA